MEERREYRCEVKSVAAFVQRVAVDLVQHGHFFYVQGEIPGHKDPRAVDAKLVERYGLNISKWSRARRKMKGEASVHLVRLGRSFVLLATRGQHRFFEEEGEIRDVRRNPLQFRGYSISYRKGVDRQFHISVRVAPKDYLRLKSFLLELALHRSAETLADILGRIPFEPYAPVRRQLLNILRAINRARLAAGFEPVPSSALRLKRRILQPLGAYPSVTQVPAKRHFFQGSSRIGTSDRDFGF